MTIAPPTQLGLILANFGRTLIVEGSDRRTYNATARKKAGTVVAGDRVDWQAMPHGDAVVIHVRPRTSLLSRPDRHGRLRAACANIDQLVVVSTLQGGACVNTALIDRYTVAAELLGIEPVLVINKIDLIPSTEQAAADRAAEEYGRLGYRLIRTSAVDKTGLEALRAVLRGRASVFVGESGVGKSSLIQILLPDLDLRIGRISEGSGAGRHTTTTTMLFHLPEGGDLIDSPGVREFRLWRMNPRELARGFREFRELPGRCKYRNCLHKGEPGCAVAAAAEDGLIEPRRLESYRAILSSPEL